MSDEGQGKQDFVIRNSSLITHHSSFLLDPFAGQAAALSARRLSQITWGLLILGIVARSIRYLLRFPLWPDEAFLSANFLERGYLDLMQPLDYGQVCPLLFLWVQLTFVKLLGFSEYTLRLFPFLCGIGSLFVFRYLAGRLLKGTALALAVGVFSVAYPLIRYSAEAKPYGCDMFVSLVLVTMAVGCAGAERKTRWLWALAAVAPIAVGLSYPAVFVAGGVSLSAALVLWTRRCGGGWPAWVVYNLVLVGSFAAFFALSTGSQYSATGQNMQALWSDAFPPLAEPGKLLGWMIVTHTSEMFQYPIGGARGASVLTLVWCLAALVLLVRKRQFHFVVLCLAPLGLNFVAAAMHSYPYGGHVRFALYASSIICLLSGLGTAVVLSLLARWPRLGRAMVLLTLAFEAGIALTAIGRDFAKPYKTVECLRERDFARWFWSSRADDGELVCLKTDMKRSFAPGAFGSHRSSVYLCNQRIYSPRHAQRRPPRMDRVSATRPLRCVEFRSSRYQYDQASLGRWLDRMQSQYRFVSQQEYRFPIRFKNRELLSVDCIEVYEFIPKSDHAVGGDPSRRLSFEGCGPESPANRRLESPPTTANRRLESPPTVR